jgi:hypothetical protein
MGNCQRVDTIGAIAECQTGMKSVRPHAPWREWKRRGCQMLGIAKGEIEMNRRYTFLFAFLFLSATGAMYRTFAQASTEENAVQQTVHTYLHGLKFNDIASFKKAFHPDAKLFFIRKNGELGKLAQEEWYQGFVTSAGKEEQGDLRIASLDITGRAASVKVVELYADSTYTDYISLLKLADDWKIVNKIYVMEKRAA